jgi:hypothetical protein
MMGVEGARLGASPPPPPPPPPAAAIPRLLRMPIGTR